MSRGNVLWGLLLVVFFSTVHSKNSDKSSISEVMEAVGTVVDAFYSIISVNLNTGTVNLSQFCQYYVEGSGLVTTETERKLIVSAACTNDSAYITVLLDNNTDIPVDIRGMSFEIKPQWMAEDGSLHTYLDRRAEADVADDGVHDSTRAIANWLCDVKASKRNADILMVNGQTVSIFQHSDKIRLYALPKDKRDQYAGVLGIYCSGKVLKQ